MAFVSKLPTSGQVPNPNEPGEWVEFRHQRVGDVKSIPHTATLAEITIAVIGKCIVAWSYPEPLTPENIDDQDEAWRDWIFKAIQDFTNIRSEAETKNSDSGSSEPLTQAATESPMSLLGSTSANGSESTT